MSATGCAALLLGVSVSLVGCGKSEKRTSSAAPDAGPLVTSGPPSAIASSPWVTKKADGTYALNPRAECIDILAGPEPVLLPSLTAARGLRATVADKRTLSIAPLGLHAKLPLASSGGPPWVLVPPAKMDVLRHGDREWHAAWAELLNRSLPFESLLFHMGDEAWDGSSVTGLARIYVVTEGVDEVQSFLRARLGAVAPRVACRNNNAYMPSSPPATVTTGESSPWKTVRTTMHLYFSDTGGRAILDLHLRRVAESTVVLAFMFESEEPEGARLALADALSKP
jgi:hypothetical protein